MMQTFYITTPIYYANSSPHLGHLYTTIVADTVKRYQKQRGFDTYFLTGTDEHGLNIQRAAQKNGRSPQAQVDAVSGEIKKLFSDFKLDEQHGGYDIFMRTTAPFHYEGVQNLWRKIAAGKTPKGNAPIYKDFYEGWFCAPCAAFKTEDEYAQPEGAEVPFCLIHERPLDRVAEESYFFRLSDYGEKLLEIIAENPSRIEPEARRNEVISFISGGLQDLSISREKKNVAWGIPVPEDENHTMYVWLDALSNYITALGYGNAERESVGFEKYWQNVTHFVGKDILRFHTVYWWSFLLAAELKLPQKVYAHGLWLDGEGRKMSKTIGNAIEPDILKKYFSIDSVRYFLLREMVFGSDGKFSYENFIERTNSDLASGLGNLSNRTLTMIRNYFGGKIPSGKIAESAYLSAKRHNIQPDAQDIATFLEHARDEYLTHFDRFDFSRALETAWQITARIDKFISETKPWDLAKAEENREILGAVLYRAAETLRWLCILLAPVMPESAAEIYAQIGLKDDITQIDPKNLHWGELSSETEIGNIEGVFPRFDKKKIMNEINAEIEEKNKNAETVQKELNETSYVAPETVSDVNKIEPPPPQNAVTAEDENFITIDDFFKVELKIGEVKVCERIPKADKLLRFEIDLGEEKPRQILAGLAEYYEPESLIGRKVVVVANLKPRKMRGLESQGMICAASLEDGTGEKPALATFIENVNIGARLK